MKKLIELNIFKSKYQREASLVGWLVVSSILKLELELEPGSKFLKLDTDEIFTEFFRHSGALLRYNGVLVNGND